MRAALIRHGIVENIILVGEGYDPGEGYGVIPVGDEPVEIGASWDGQSFTLPAPLPASTDDVGVERDRRLVSDFTFQGVKFQRDQRSLQRITGAATLAGFAMGAGAQPGNLRWANPSRDFVWIASDNGLMPMDAQTCFQFGQVAANVETSIIFAAKALREMEPIPADFADDKWWP